MNNHQLIKEITTGNYRALARGISLVENEADGYETLMSGVSSYYNNVIGVTGPPGAGKSTLVDCLIKEIIATNKKVGVICVDPSSPFNKGAILGDRIRMSQWYNHPNVFIRSLSSRGSMGGLHPKIIEITDLMNAAGFDYIIIETIGVGQTEIEIAGLANITLVVVVPESGDSIQTMKSGLMEIADIFVLNKYDRPGADEYLRNLYDTLNLEDNRSIPVIKTIAEQGFGVDALYEAIQHALENNPTPDKKYWLLAEKAYHLIQANKMAGIKKGEIFEEISRYIAEHNQFNLYQFIKSYIQQPGAANYKAL